MRLVTQSTWVIALTAVSLTNPQQTAGQQAGGNPNLAWGSSYTVPEHPATFIYGATLMTATGEEYVGNILLSDGKIEAIGTDVQAPSDAIRISGQGRFVTPGLIDDHSHVGVSSTPEVPTSFDNNEVGMTTPGVWIEHSIWPQGPGFARVLRGGTTTLHLLPGSGDLIEGRGVTVKPVPAITPQEMIFPDAPHTVKLACGENPKRGAEFPTTKMGNVYGYRQAFIDGARYRDEWDAWLANPSGNPPARDLHLETLAEVLRGNILVQWHCYTADEMATNLRVAREFGFHVRSFHHAVEAYKIRDLLAETGTSASMWSENWGFKMEAFDGISENVALVSSAGAIAIVHSDDDMRAQYMNHEAAKAMGAAHRRGMEVSRDEALRWVTANPAWALGIHELTGTLEVGKNADVVLWSSDPFSVYALADMVWIDGAKRWDRFDPDTYHVSDFELGLETVAGSATPVWAGWGRER